MNENDELLADAAAREVDMAQRIDELQQENAELHRIIGKLESDAQIRESNWQRLFAAKQRLAEELARVTK